MEIHQSTVFFFSPNFFPDHSTNYHLSKRDSQYYDMITLNTGLGS